MCVCVFYVGLLSLFVFFIKGLSAPQETTLDPPADLLTEVCTSPSVCMGVYCGPGCSTLH